MKSIDKALGKVVETDPALTAKTTPQQRLA
jgi:hypothetical protein